MAIAAVMLWTQHCLPIQRDQDQGKCSTFGQKYDNKQLDYAEYIEVDLSEQDPSHAVLIAVRSHPFMAHYFLFSGGCADLWMRGRPTGSVFDMCYLSLFSV